MPIWKKLRDDDDHILVGPGIADFGVSVRIDRVDEYPDESLDSHFEGMSGKVINGEFTLGGVKLGSTSTLVGLLAPPSRPTMAGPAPV